MIRIIYIALFLLFFSGCSVSNLSKSSVKSKEQLIQNANNGSIKAMIKLNKFYQYPYTKEGLNNFSKWYKTIDEKDNKKEVQDIANIYAKYNTMFINGIQKTEKLYELASKNGNYDASLDYISFLLEEKKNSKAIEIKNQIFLSLNEEQIRKLEKLFRKHYLEELDDIVKYMEEKKIRLSFESALSRIENSSNNEEEFIVELKKLINKKAYKLKSENKQKLNTLLKRRYTKYGYFLVSQELLKIDAKNDVALLKLGQLYRRGIYKKVQKDKIKGLGYIRKAFDLGNKEAGISLLVAYSKKKEFKEDYFEVLNKLNSSQEGQLVLVKYYKIYGSKQKAEQLLKELANSGNIDAIVDLALMKKSGFYVNHEKTKLQEKWQNYILTSKNQELRELYKNRLFEYKNSRNHKDALLEITKDDVKIRNILVLRKLDKTLRFFDLEKSIEYRNLAIEAGDIKSAISFTDTFIKRGIANDEEFNRYSKILEELAIKGDIRSKRRLGNLYLEPPRGFKKYKDVKRGLIYLEELANKADVDSLKNVIYAYLYCKNCRKKNGSNYKKAHYYLLKLIKANEALGKHYNVMGWLYNTGNGVAQNLQIAKEYYEKAVAKGYAQAYYSLAWLYYKDRSSTIEPIELNYSKSLNYLEKGSREYVADAINLLAVFYEKGYGVKKDINKAVSLYKKVAKYNNMSSYHLGKYYKRIKDYTNAKKYFEMSARLRNSASMVELGILYEQGSLGEINIQKAINSYKKAYKEDKSQIAAFNLGLVYHYGKGGVKVDYQTAKLWYKRSHIQNAKKQLALLNK